MNCLSAAVGNFRSERKCFSISGSLLLMLLLFAAEVASRPTDELHESFDVPDEYTDVDNIEWHHVKVVDGVLHEDHPIVMYKEDFVSEDYDQSKNRTQFESRPQRKYMDIARRRLNHTDTSQYRALKPEKIYFDVLPQAPLIVVDDSAGNDSKFDAAKIRVEVIPLTNDDALKSVTTDANEPLKEQLNKRPKKYHSRQRRNAELTDAEEDLSVVRSKRNPYYRTGSVANTLEDLLKRYYETVSGQAQSAPKKSAPVQGKFWNANYGPVNLPEVPQSQDQQKVVEPTGTNQRFGGPDNTDRVTWGSSKNSVAPRRPSTNTERPAMSTSGNVRRPPPPLFHDSNPANANLDFMTARPFSTTPSSVRTPQGPTSAPSKESVEEQVSHCVWAVVNCCSSRDINIRYNCFEELNCTGAFWDLNPCADGVKDNLVNYVGEIYN